MKTALKLGLLLLAGLQAFGQETKKAAKKPVDAKVWMSLKGALQWEETYAG